MRPVWCFDVDDGTDRFRVAIVADARDCCSSWSTIGTGRWHRDDGLNMADILFPEHENAGWDMTEIAAPADLVEFLGG